MAAITSIQKQLEQQSSQLDQHEQRTAALEQGSGWTVSEGGAGASAPGTPGGVSAVGKAGARQVRSPLWARTAPTTRPELTQTAAPRSPKSASTMTAHPLHRCCCLYRTFGRPARVGQRSVIPSGGSPGPSRGNSRQQIYPYFYRNTCICFRPISEANWQFVPHLLLPQAPVFHSPSPPSFCVSPLLPVSVTVLRLVLALAQGARVGRWGMQVSGLLQILIYLLCRFLCRSRPGTQPPSILRGCLWV